MNAGCNPQGTGTGYASATMTKSGSNFTITISGLAPTTWNLNDVLNIRAVIADPDGTNGSPLNGTLTLLDVIQAPTAWGNTKIRAKAADLSGNYNAATTITADSDNFGYQLAAHGRIMIATAPQDDNSTLTLTAADNSATDSGAVYILRDTSAGGDWSSYVIDKYLKSPTNLSGETFGAGVAFDGTTLAIGATHLGRATMSEVYVYREASVDGNWSDVTLKDTIDEPSYITITDYFGSAIAISGRNIFIGEYGEDTADETSAEGSTTSSDYGAVNVYYDTVGDGSGYPAAPDKRLKERNDSNAVNATLASYFGKSLSYSGSSLLVGAPGRIGSGVQGKAIVYSCKVTATGTPCGPTINWAAGTNTITAKVLTTTTPMNVPATPAESYYGFSVSLDDDDAVVGAYGDNTPNEADNTGTTVNNAGAAYVWHSTNGNADWSTIVMEKKLKMRNSSGTVAPTANYSFGYSVALQGPVIAVSASRAPSTAHCQINMFKDNDGDANYSTGSVVHHELIDEPYLWATGHTNRFGDTVILDNSGGTFHLFSAAWGESSTDTVLATDTNPTSGVGFQSGSVFVYAP